VNWPYSSRADLLGPATAASSLSGAPWHEGSAQACGASAAFAAPGVDRLSATTSNIPKGSAGFANRWRRYLRCMRATRQAASLTGGLEESERRLVLARALLGEWLGGSGGGWQDSGGVWPGMKLIEGVLASEGDPEVGISRGRLMPQHRILTSAEASAETRKRLQDSLVLVHGGMAQNVGPILEMVTEKYLLRSAAEWRARQSMLGILDEILTALKQGDVPNRRLHHAQFPTGILPSGLATTCRTET